jgi:putative spermidine/putrescine transport system substrate-binding protein
MMAQVPLLKGIQAELWAPLDPAKLPNLEHVKPEFINKYPDGRIAGVGAVTWYITLVSNTEAYPEAPDSWAFLWDPANKDKLGLLSLATNSFLLDITAKTFFADNPDILDTQEGILQVLNKIAELKPNVKLWYRDEGQFQQALESGEIPMGQYYHDVTGLAASKGQPVRSTFPKEGGVNDSGSWVVSRASQALENAHVFIDYMCRPATQALLSRKVGTSPTVKTEALDLTPEEFAGVSSEIPPIIPRYDIYQSNADWLNQKWTELIVGG